MRLLCVALPLAAVAVQGQTETPLIPLADAQPLAANVIRVTQALRFLGSSLDERTTQALQTAAQARDGTRIQELLDPHVLLIVTINPESRVKVQRGAAKATLQQAGFQPVLVKVINQSTATKELRMVSPQAGQVYAGMSPLSAQRMQRTHLKETAQKDAAPGRFLDLEIYARPPMRSELSGFEVEYAIGLIYSSEAGKREATIGFDIGQGNQDIGFRGEVPILFEVRPAVRVELKIADHDGQPTAASLLFRDQSGHVFPPQAKRLAPDFYFQPQIYRADGDAVWLPPGELAMEYSRGPEYRRLRRVVKIPDQATAALDVKLERWIDPMEFGYYGGDHHIHGAGCAHYTSPTEGVTPEDMFLQVQGEGLNVGCVLTWGPCFEYQRRFFAPSVHQLSRALTVMKYDLEISGFGSEALGHVCLLNLKDQNFPGSDGTKVKGWPSWTTPLMRWAKAQGAVTGYAHSASGLGIDPAAATKRLFARFDANKDRMLVGSECSEALLPLQFEAIDSDRDHALSEAELSGAHDRAADQLPNLAIPEMNGVGAMEIAVSVAAGVCDFISAMDTPRIAEWNMWYHLLNCGFPLKVSGETDFPCMSGERVGQGRVYVRLGKVKKLDFAAWCEGLAKGRSYVSDGFAHALEFSVNGVEPGAGDLQLAGPAKVRVRAKVAFAPEIPRMVAQGTIIPPGGRKFVGDTVTLHGSRT
ncbi:MAG: CehA/McbA family metallohydrolase, partial [Verrucomicrobiales bacterium]|nr:CehA/McbA family metallohydrolase [Verrucomicrobiales bacterium]